MKKLISEFLNSKELCIPACIEKTRKAIRTGQTLEQSKKIIYGKGKRWPYLKMKYGAFTSECTELKF